MLYARKGNRSKTFKGWVEPMGARRSAAALMASVMLFALVACTSSDPEATQPRTPSPGTPVPTEASDTETTAGTTAPTTTSTVSTTEATEPGSFTVVVNGDLLLHEGLWATAEIDAARTGRGVRDFRALL